MRRQVFSTRNQLLPISPHQGRGVRIIMPQYQNARRSLLNTRRRAGRAGAGNRWRERVAAFLTRSYSAPIGRGGAVAKRRHSTDRA